MATLSNFPSAGPPLPSGCTRVSVGGTYQTATEDAKIDVTTLSDSERVYADPPLIDAGANGEDGEQTVTAEWYASGVGDVEISLPGSTGWVCTQVDYDITVGEFIKGSATWKYVPPS